MPDFLFYKKGRQVVAVERQDAQRAETLVAQGFEKQFNEVTATCAENALKRYYAIRKDEADLEYGFMTGGLFGLVTLLVRG